MTPVHAKRQHAQEDTRCIPYIRLGTARMLYTVAMMLEGLKVFPSAWSPQRHFFAQCLIKTGHYILGFIACAITCNCLGDYWWLQRYDRSITVLDRAIARLESKQASDQPAAAA
jgi:hypothetical protein